MVYLGTREVQIPRRKKCDRGELRYWCFDEQRKCLHARITKLANMACLGDISSCHPLNCGEMHLI